MRGIAPAQVKGAKISVCHGVGCMFAASGTIISRARDRDPRSVMRHRPRDFRADEAPASPGPRYKVNCHRNRHR